ncbi:class I SAM-dependent methyltransferase [Bradyrhizobium diversitatis]|uniref:Methyltransferase domain-containing protein n=1 Tax=Bradyrhizobium diversitatis TaxID=2755406 RepID=A0ABS0NZI3_9BRAD|nr:class I SAM-dependent methyltransferase [Bradyrhizobium diversitatis]MBH5386429.1 methyltransferase domain-containing protein [Bradyrhizobium diversitatis]
MDTSLQRPTQSWSRYDKISAQYDRSRPGYPAEAVQLILDRAASVRTRKPIIIDVGSGTGIFTRMLASTVEDTEVIGVEPNEAMISRARQTASTGKIVYHSAPAECLPFLDSSIALISAAGSAQLFDRKTFYLEARRVLVDTGCLAIIQNKRDLQSSGLLRAFETFMEARVTGYRTGRFADNGGGHSAAPFADELRQCNVLQFDGANVIPWDRVFTEDTFVDFAFSTIQLQMAAESFGRDVIETELRELVAEVADTDGQLRAAYRTEITWASKPHSLG